MNPSDFRANASFVWGGGRIFRGFNLTQYSERGTPKNYHEQIAKENREFVGITEKIRSKGCCT